MTLSAGTKLGPYEILAPLGSGGMGEVYRAKDSRLGREVAIKVLPQHLSSSPEVRQRFEREAKTISQLSHPHICALYDVGREGENEYLVMELLEGETLSDRLAKGPLPLEQTLRFGVEIADALDKAHRQGIVHRDLKPGNVMLTRSGVKLLDFGLAKAITASKPESSVTALPTQQGLTQEGTILGTFQYMAPEQLEGRDADGRTDIFAFGAVLYEMVTGRKAFSGASQASLISAIMQGEPPPISSVQPASPAALDRIVRTCLAKDPEERWQSASDLKRELRWIGEGSPSGSAAATARAAPRRLRWLPWVVAGLCAVLAAGAVWRYRTTPARPARTVRFPLPPPRDRAFYTTYESTPVAVSPDGSRIAFVSSPFAVSAARRGIASPDLPGTRSVWIRELGSLEARPIPGTEDATSIFWSPDGKALGFFAGKLKRIELAAGAAAVPIADLPPGGGRAGSWGSGGDILFASVQGAAILRVSAAGGVPEKVIEPQVSLGEFRLNWPWYLPDGKRFLYLARLAGGQGRLMLGEVGKPSRIICPMASAVQYVTPGYIVFAREGALLAQRFDPDAGRVSGEPIAIAERVNYFLSTGYAAFAASPSGTLVYQSNRDVSRLAWFDLAGRSLGTIGQPGNYLNLATDRAGRRIFYDRARPDIGTFDIWSWDLARGLESAVTSDPETEVCPVELPGGRSIVYSANRAGAPELFRRNLETGADERLTKVQRAFQRAQDVSPDGRTLVYVERSATGNFDIWTLPLSGSGQPAPFFQSPFDKKDVRFSPDGRFLAFVSNESGQSEAYVTAYPGPGERIRISSDGARLLRWSRAGAIIYASGNGRVMSIQVETNPVLKTGTPTELFAIAGKPWPSFELANDDKKLLAVVPEVAADEQPMTVVVDWPASLKE